MARKSILNNYYIFDPANRVVVIPGVITDRVVSGIGLSNIFTKVFEDCLLIILIVHWSFGPYMLNTIMVALFLVSVKVFDE